MKILQLCKKFPFPMWDGESIAVNQLARGLASQGCEMHLLAMNTSKHRFDWTQLPPHYDTYKSIQSVEVDNSVTLLGAAAHLLRRDSYHAARFRSSAFAEKLANTLRHNHFDIVQLETPYLAHYLPVIREHSKAKIVLRAHNVEHEVWLRLAENSATGPKRWYLQKLSAQLKAFETAALDKIDLLIAISQRDLDRLRTLGYKGKAMAHPLGIDIEHYDIKNHKPNFQEKSVAFIGSLDWLPNQEGLLWFVGKVWAPLTESFPDWTLQVAGRNTPPAMLRADWPQVRVRGEVENAAAFMAQSPIMVAPLLSGSGLRVKILEGMALGMAVVTTTVGLEGIHARAGKEVLVADDAAAFREALATLMRKAAVAERLGKAARHFIGTEFDGPTLTRQLLSQYRSLLRNKSHMAKPVRQDFSAF